MLASLTRVQAIASLGSLGKPVDSAGLPWGSSLNAGNLPTLCCPLQMGESWTPHPPILSAPPRRARRTGAAAPGPSPRPARGGARARPPRTAARSPGPRVSLVLAKPSPPFHSSSRFFNRTVHLQFHRSSSFGAQDLLRRTKGGRQDSHGLGRRWPRYHSSDSTRRASEESAGHHQDI